MAVNFAKLPEMLGSQSRKPVALPSSPEGW